MELTIPDDLIPELDRYVEQYNKGGIEPVVSPITREDALLSFVLPHLQRLQRETHEAQVTDAVNKFLALDSEKQGAVLVLLGVQKEAK